MRKWKQLRRDSFMVQKMLTRWPFEEDILWLRCYNDGAECPCPLHNACLYELRHLVNVYSEILGFGKLKPDAVIAKKRSLKVAKAGLLILLLEFRDSVDEFVGEALSQYD